MSACEDSTKGLGPVDGGPVDGGEGDGGEDDGGAATFDRAPPNPALWARLSDDVFAQIVIHARRGLHKLEQVHSTPEVRRLKAIPTPRLVRGHGRARLLSAMGEGGPVWLAVRTRLETDPDLLATLTAALDSLRNDHLDGRDPDDGEEAARDRARVTQQQRHNAMAQLRSQRDGAVSQRDQARVERDEARAQRDGAVGREAGLRDRIEELEQVLGSCQADLAALTTDIAAHDDQMRQALDRERRRGTAQREGLDRDLADARRELDRARRQISRLERTGAGATLPPTTATLTTPPVAAAGVAWSRDDDMVVPGRPSRLPARVRLDTREGALELLAPGRVVLVDGYNVTRTHKPDLSLEQQRQWLRNGLGSLATRTRVDVTVIFDAHVEGAYGGGGGRRRGVTVRYSMPGITADDELVLAVEAMAPDAPVIVVTDDRELRSRLSALGADLLHTAVLVWLL